MSERPTIIPAIRYKDAPAAIEFLCDALGFERHLVVDGDAGAIVHAQLTFNHGGRGMIMLGTQRDDAFSGTGPTCLCVLVDDVDGHCARARAAGAEIFQEPADQDYGGRLYSCRDPEGNIWSFGSYDPWAG